MFGEGLFVIFYSPNKIVFSLCQLLGVPAHRHAVTALVLYRSLSNSYSSEIVILDDTKTQVYFPGLQSYRNSKQLLKLHQQQM